MHCRTREDASSQLNCKLSGLMQNNRMRAHTHMRALGGGEWGGPNTGGQAAAAAACEAAWECRRGQSEERLQQFTCMLGGLVDAEQECAHKC